LFFGQECLHIIGNCLSTREAIEKVKQKNLRAEWSNFSLTKVGIFQQNDYSKQSISPQQLVAKLL